MTQIYPVFERIVPRSEKEHRLNQKSKIVWFTGLSGSGKTTLAIALERSLFDKGFLTQILDGDNIRTGINNNLGFSPVDRIENIRRIAEIGKLFLGCGIICICAFVSPTRELRKIVRDIAGEENFIEIFVSTPLELCESRDVKGLYAKARSGEVKEFTGISAPFEIPEHASLVIDTSDKTVNECLEILLQKVLPEVTLVS
jgi:adenylylsulfate kinase